MTALALVAITIAVVSPAAAQDAGELTLDWFIMDSGGDTSTGGDFSLVSSIGRPDAGTMSGGDWQVQGGFWNRLIVNRAPVTGFMTFYRSKNSSLKIKITNLMTNVFDPDGDTNVLFSVTQPRLGGVLTNLVQRQLKLSSDDI